MKTAALIVIGLSLLSCKGENGKTSIDSNIDVSIQVASDYTKMDLIVPYSLVYINKKMLLVGDDNDVHLEGVTRFLIKGQMILIETAIKQSWIGKPYVQKTKASYFLINASSGEFKSFGNLSEMIMVARISPTDELMDAKVRMGVK